MPSSFDLKSSSMDDENEQSRKEDDGEVSEDDYDGNSDVDVDVDVDEEYEYSSDGENDDDDDDDDHEGLAAGQDLCDGVIDLLQREKSLDVLKLNQCKAYLRKHSLRLSGTKATCIERIQEHWRIKDGNGEILYPKSSFVINCRGDVCKGDVVLFKQRIFSKFDIVTRGANVIGKRIVAGRIVKESYGAAKQQHTFTVEILWSEGVQALPPLFPLLVKGRNLYRLKTFRQPWTDEAERSKVLDEKHKRGAAARHARAIAKVANTNKGFKRPKMSSSKGMPPKRQRMAEMLPSRPSCKQKNCYETTQPNRHRRAKKVWSTKYPGSSSSDLLKETRHYESQIHTQFIAPCFHHETAPANNHGKAKNIWNTRFPGSLSSGLSKETCHGNEIHTQFGTPSFLYESAPANIHANAKKFWNTRFPGPSSSRLLKEIHGQGNEIQAQFGAPSFHYPYYNVAYPSTPSGMIRQELLNPSHYNDYRYNSYSSQIDPRTSGHLLRHVELDQRSACPSVMQFSGRRRQW